MAKVTSKYQVTVPRKIADAYAIRPGDEIDWIPAGDVIRVIPGGKRAVALDRESRLRFFDQATQRQEAVRERHSRRSLRIADGAGRICTLVDALLDTNILIYRYDSRFPEKQKIATDLLRGGIAQNSVLLPHQAIVEFVAAATRPVRGHVILQRVDTLQEAEEFLSQFVAFLSQ